MLLPDQSQPIGAHAISSKRRVITKVCDINESHRLMAQINCLQDMAQYIPSASFIANHMVAYSVTVKNVVDVASHSKLCYTSHNGTLLFFCL